MRIAKIRMAWPRLEPPSKPASITVTDLLGVPDGPENYVVIRQWMASVWESSADRQAWVRETTGRLIGREPEW